MEAVSNGALTMGINGYSGDVCDMRHQGTPIPILSRSTALSLALSLHLVPRCLGAAVPEAKGSLGRFPDGPNDAPVGWSLCRGSCREGTQDWPTGKENPIGARGTPSAVSANYIRRPSPTQRWFSTRDRTHSSTLRSLSGSPTLHIEFSKLAWNWP